MFRKAHLYLTRVDVLTSTDNHVLQATCDTQVTAFIHRAQVARMEPSIGFERRSRGLGHVKVAQHRLVATSTDLALLTDRKHLIRVKVNNFDLNLGQWLPNCLGLVFRSIVVMRIADDAMEFCLSKNN